MENTHLHFLIWFYDRKDDRGNFQNVTAVDVLASDIEEAIEKAQQFDDREFFHVKNVTEHHTDHGGLTNERTI